MSDSDDTIAKTDPDYERAAELEREVEDLHLKEFEADRKAQTHKPAARRRRWLCLRRMRLQRKLVAALRALGRPTGHWDPHEPLPKPYDALGVAHSKWTMLVRAHDEADRERARCTRIGDRSGEFRAECRRVELAYKRARAQRRYDRALYRML